ncbi:MAG: hypothetical protein K2K53_13075 [Oscillospiraceae bacterium]|nr:hypothetical protein [Oscillospiraceae bacterium]
MNNPKDLIIPADVVELSHLQSDCPVCAHIGENTLVVAPERMSAIQAVNAIGMLTAFTSDLIDALKSACGACEDLDGGGRLPLRGRLPGQVPLRDCDRAGGGAVR